MVTTSPAPDNLVNVESPQHFQELLSKDLKRVSLINFWATWAEPCQQMNQVVLELARRWPNVLVLQLEADALQDISESFEIEAVPSFVILKGHSLLSRINGADAPGLTTALAKHGHPNAAGQAQTDRSPEAPVEKETEEELVERMKKIMRQSRVVLFMKGSPDAPRCGFSRQTVSILRDHGVQFTHFDILQDEYVRQGLKTLNNWPTFPQLIVNGEFIGGLDIIKEAVETGEFDDLFFAEPVPPLKAHALRKGNHRIHCQCMWMAQLDVFPVDFEFAHPKDSFAVRSEVSDDHFLPCSSVLDGGYINDPTPAFESEIVFSELPKLLSGHTDIHLREGIIHAFADNAPNSERAFFAADLSQVYAQHARWVRNLPDVEPFFAVKSNPDIYVLRLLAGLGAGFDCASHNEIRQVLDLGVDPSRVIFANPCKPLSFIRSAAKESVDMMTFDNADELVKISRVHPKAKLVLRILTDDSKSLCRLGLKFGAPLSSVPMLLARARELNLDVIGVSFHVGSGCMDPYAFGDAVSYAKQAFVMGSSFGFKFTLLDVGGGFEDREFENMAAVLREAIDTHFPGRKEEGIRIIAEPGRFFVARAFTLATNIIAKRVVSTDDMGNDKPRVMYYINDGVYGSFNCIMFDHQTVHPYVVTLNGSFPSSSSLARETLIPCSIWGPTCDSIDCVCPLVELPSGLEVGDWLGFRGMGAYTLCAASRFNGFETSQVVYTSGIEGSLEANAVRRVLRAMMKREATKQ